MKIPTGLKQSAAMVVLRHQNQFLLLERNKAPNKGKIVPVGGKVDPFEDPYSAALRETWEETGIRLQHAKYCGILIESSPTTYNWQSSIYIADIDWQEPPACNEGNLLWVDRATLLELPTPPTDWEIYKYILTQKPFAFNAIYDAQLKLLSMVEEIEGIQVI